MCALAVCSSVGRDAGCSGVPACVCRFAGPFDLTLDTCAEMAGHCSPTIGASELTLTGELLYRALAPAYPVISVDASRVKRVEDAIGSADGLVRALTALIPEPLTSGPYVVFGFGKVGLGIAHRLAGLSPAGVTIVETSAIAMDLAKRLGYTRVLYVQ